MATHAASVTPSFDCNICFEPANSPVVTGCGHLYCWPCLEVWLGKGARDCPVCRGYLDDNNIIPILGRGHVPDEYCGRPRPRNRRLSMVQRNSEYMLDLGILSFSYSSNRHQPRFLDMGSVRGAISTDDARKRAITQFLIFLGIVLIILVISS